MLFRRIAGVAGALVVMTLVSGFVLDDTQQVTMSVHVPGSPLAVYGLVADPRQPWRASLERVTVQDSLSWTETPRRGAPILFTRTVAEPGKRLAVRFSSSGFEGEWDGRFDAHGTDSTRVTFTERVTVPSPWLRSISRLFFGPERAMREYAEELMAATNGTKATVEGDRQ